VLLTPDTTVSVQYAPSCGLVLGPGRFTVNRGLYNTKLDDGAQAVAVWTIFGSSGSTSSSLDPLMSSSSSAYMWLKLLALPVRRR